MSRKYALAAGAAALALVIIAGTWLYGRSQTRLQQESIAQLVADTTARLREALSAPASGEAMSRIDANLRAARAPRDAALADAAEHYILGAREIVRRRVEGARLEREAAASRQALAAHMARASSRNNAWIKEAMALKKKVERSHYDLSLTLKALDELLFTFPDAEKRLAPHVDHALLLDVGVREAARKQAREDAARAAAELEKLRSLAPR